MPFQGSFIRAPNTFPGIRRSKRIRLVYANLDDPGWEEFRKFLAWDQLSGIQWCTRAINDYRDICRKHYAEMNEKGAAAGGDREINDGR